MSIELESLGTLAITIERQTLLSTTPAGGRLVGEAADCRWEGPGISARQLGRSASDWVRIHADGSMSVDARILLQTHDGATIALSYLGKADRSPAEGGTIFTTPRFETGDERYGWLNAIQAVGKGRREGMSLIYELYALR